MWIWYFICEKFPITYVKWKSQMWKCSNFVCLLYVKSREIFVRVSTKVREKVDPQMDRKSNRTTTALNDILIKHDKGVST